MFSTTISVFTVYVAQPIKATVKSFQNPPDHSFFFFTDTQNVKSYTPFVTKRSAPNEEKNLGEVVGMGQVYTLPN